MLARPQVSALGWEVTPTLEPATLVSASGTAPPSASTVVGCLMSGSRLPMTHGLVGVACTGLAGRHQSLHMSLVGAWSKLDKKERAPWSASGSAVTSAT